MSTRWRMTDQNEVLVPLLRHLVYDHFDVVFVLLNLAFDQLVIMLLISRLLLLILLPKSLSRKNHSGWIFTEERGANANLNCIGIFLGHSRCLLLLLFSQISTGYECIRSFLFLLAFFAWFCFKNFSSSFTFLFTTNEMTFNLIESKSPYLVSYSIMIQCSYMR